jgi:hypothetical protein
VGLILKSVRELQTRGFTALLQIIFFPPQGLEPDFSAKSTLTKQVIAGGLGLLVA